MVASAPRAVDARGGDLNLWSASRRAALLAAALAMLAACAHRTPVIEQTAAAADTYWSGRIALQLLVAPVRSFAAAFELKGRPQQGALALFSPMGTTLAVLEWAPGSATLRSDGDPPREFTSVDALVSHVVGVAIPIATLFDWLQGRATPASGWQVDLSRIDGGHLQAHRFEPEPQASLKLVLDRPATAN